MTKRKPGVRPIGDSRTVRIAGQRRAEPDLALFARAVAETLFLSLDHNPQSPPAFDMKAKGRMGSERADSDQVCR